MAITKPPKGSPHPLPIGYVPPGGRPYHPVDGEDWKKLAYRWFINHETLIWFNFQTLNTDEVNWYLYRNVGCRNETKDKFNYVFGTNDKPGIIYIPPSKPIVFHDAIDEFNENMGSGTDLGKALQDADRSGSIYDYVGFSLNVSDFVLTSLAISGVELGALGLGLDLFGAVAGFVAVGLSLGSPHYDAINSKKNGNNLSGLSRGIVLGAARESNAFIKEYFVAGSEDHDDQYPEQRKNFQNAYLWGLLKGLEYGKKLTKHERLLFFKHVEALAGYRSPGDFYMNRHSKGEITRKNIYIELASKFRKESTK
jgi:hypothetical protein